MSTSQGIAVAGIWIGTGLSSIGGGGAVAVVAILALFATFIVVCGNN